MIFRFETMKNDSKNDTTANRAKRLIKELRPALAENANLTSPTVSNVSVTTITGVTVYPY
ncbi:MAG: hypothetical protein AAF903_15735 [Pseudomonadota bacterium]